MDLLTHRRSQIAKEFPERSACSVAKRYQRLIEQNAPAKPRPWSESDVELLWDLKRRGLSVRAIASTLGRTKGAITNKSNRNLRPGRPARYTEDEASVILRMRATQASWAEIAAALGTGRNARALKAYYYRALFNPVSDERSG